MTISFVVCDVVIPLLEVVGHVREGGIDQAVAGDVDVVVLVLGQVQALKVLQRSQSGRFYLRPKQLSKDSSVTRFTIFENSCQQICLQTQPKKIGDFWAILKLINLCKTAEDIIQATVVNIWATFFTNTWSNCSLV